MAKKKTKKTNKSYKHMMTDGHMMKDEDMKTGKYMVKKSKKGKKKKK